jgi:hypothetical protein
MSKHGHMHVAAHFTHRSASDWTPQRRLTSVPVWEIQKTGGLWFKNLLFKYNKQSVLIKNCRIS